MTQTSTTPDLSQLAQDAYVWGLPVVQTRLYLKLARDLNLPFNQLFGSPQLSSPRSKVPLPNVDTLYGLGWLDLAAEPQILSVPEAHDRYYLIQLNDAYLNSFSYVGRRTTGTHPGLYAIVGPDWQGTLPQGVKPIAAPTNHVLVLTRTLVLDEADLPAARAVQDGFSLTALSDFPRFTHPNRPIEDAFNNFPILNPVGLGASYFDELGAALADDPPPERDRAFVDSLAAIGVGPGLSPSHGADPALQTLLAEAVVKGNALVHGRGGWLIDTRDVNGWMVSYGITSFIPDPLDRAVVAKLGPGCLVPQEGLYFSMRNGPDGVLLTGDKAYVLEFPPGQTPPVDAFWSLTLYGENWALVDNPIDRYAIGDRTKGLRLSPDGPLRIFIQHEPPAEGISNWLPAPAASAGPFHLFLRTYQPRPDLSDGRYRMPPLALAPTRGEGHPARATSQAAEAR
ncbi:MAG: DUF1254 domain-containing protein [Caulobacteraceae bacterium]|nr:DUF1254 domain-containing protein [Caulobacteraceae bacterium]